MCSSSSEAEVVFSSSNEAEVVRIRRFCSSSNEAAVVRIWWYATVGSNDNEAAVVCSSVQ